MLKKNGVALAIAMAMSGAANAAIDTGQTGNGELFLTVWDDVAKVAYTRDLGIHLEDFLTSSPQAMAPLQFTGTNTWNTFMSQVSNPANLVWNIGALDSTGNGKGGERYLTTSNTTLSTIQTKQRNSNVTSMDVANSFLISMNGEGTHADGVFANNGEAITYPTDAAAYPMDPVAFWGNNWGGKATGWTDTAGIDQSMSFFYITPSSTSITGYAYAEQYGVVVNGAFVASTWTLSSNGDLNYVPPTIPVPAGVWLLGSALVGLMGVARRKQA